MPDEQPEAREIDALLVALRDEIEAIPTRESDDRRYPEKNRRRVITALAAELSVRGLTVDQISEGVNASIKRVRRWIADGRRERGLPRAPHAPRVWRADPERAKQLLQQLAGAHPKVSAAAQRAADRTAVLLLRANLLALEVDMLGEALDADEADVERLTRRAAKAYESSLLPHRPRTWTPEDAHEADQILVELAIVDEEYQEAFEGQRSLILELRSLGVGTPSLDVALATYRSGSKRFIEEAEASERTSRRPARPPAPAADEAFSFELWMAAMHSEFVEENEREADFETLSSWAADLEHLHKRRLLLAVHAHFLGADLSSAMPDGVNTHALNSQITRVLRMAKLTPIEHEASSTPTVVTRRRLVLDQLRAVSRRIASDEGALKRLEAWIGATGAPARARAATITKAVRASRPSISKSDPVLRRLRQSQSQTRLGAAEISTRHVTRPVSPAEAGAWGSDATRRRLVEAYGRLTTAERLRDRLILEAHQGGASRELLADLSGASSSAGRPVSRPTRGRVVVPVAPFVGRLSEARQGHDSMTRDLDAAWLQLDAADFTLAELATATDESEKQVRRHITTARIAADKPGLRPRTRLSRYVNELSDEQRAARLIAARDLAESLLGAVSQHTDDRWPAAQEAYDAGVSLAVIAQVLGSTESQLRVRLTARSERSQRDDAPAREQVRGVVVSHLRDAVAHVVEAEREVDEALRAAWDDGMRSDSIGRAVNRDETKIRDDIHRARKDVEADG